MPCLHGSLRWRLCSQCSLLIGFASMAGIAMGLPYTAAAACGLALHCAESDVVFSNMNPRGPSEMFLPPVFTPIQDLPHYVSTGPT
eukprot:84775-Pelagomonas_calceolata.AAC.1